MRILLTTIPSYGHFARVLSAARRLAAKGHDVCVAGSSRFEQELRQAAIAHAPVGLSAFPEAPAGAALTTRWLVREAMPELTLRMYDDLLGVFDTFAPELVIRDFAERAAGFVAEARGVPHVSIAAESLAGVVSAANIGGWVDRTRAAVGLPSPAGSDAQSPLLHMFPCPPEFHGSGTQLLAATRFVRHQNDLVDEPGADAILRLLDRSRPLVVVALGTIVSSVYPTLVGELLEALRGRPLSAVFVFGGDHERVEELADDRVVAVNAPQQALLANADVVVTHGGFQTVTEALAEGLPLVLVPRGADTDYAAARCAALGVGEICDPPRGDALDASIARVLGHAAYRSAADHFRRRNDALPSVVEMLAELRIV